MQNNILLQNEQDLYSKIFLIRGVQVMFDYDLAKIYGYETKDFNRQVKNNIERFEEDFRFQLSHDELEELNLRCKIFTSSYENKNDSGWGGKRYLPYVFTELGTANEIIYHCGGSSKDAGIRVTSISQVEDKSNYQTMINALLKNHSLVL